MNERTVIAQMLSTGGEGVNWTSPVSICPRTGDRRLPTPVSHPGTHSFIHLFCNK